MAGVAAGAVSGNPNIGAIVAGQQAGMQAATIQAADIQLSENFKLPDPAKAIATTLASSLAKKHGMMMVGGGVRVDSARPSLIAKSVPGADYVLKVTTTGTGMMYGLLSPTKYHLLASITMQLVDARTGKVVVSGREFTNDTSSKATTSNYDGILANNAAFVSQELAKFRVVAENHFRRDLLKL